MLHGYAEICNIFWRLGRRESRMLTKSAKAKGRLLQNWVRTQIAFWIGLENSDVTTAIMGEKGADVKIIKEKQHLFPMKIECKSQKTGFSSVYKAYSQCINHPGRGEPLVIIKQDRQEPLAILDATYFFREWRQHDKK